MENRENKIKLYNQLVFIHQVLTQRSQFFVSEFEVAKDATTTITAMANEIKKELDASAPESNEKETASETKTGDN